VPGDITHDFQNRSKAQADLLNLSIPGPFEPEMEGMAQCAAENSAAISPEPILK